jgi:hypothetical protein
MLSRVDHAERSDDADERFPKASLHGQRFLQLDIRQLAREYSNVARTRDHQIS